MKNPNSDRKYMKHIHKPAFAILFFVLSFLTTIGTRILAFKLGFITEENQDTFSVQYIMWVIWPAFIGIWYLFSLNSLFDIFDKHDSFQKK